MAFLDELKDRAMDLGRAGVAKSKQLVNMKVNRIYRSIIRYICIYQMGKP